MIGDDLLKTWDELEASRRQMENRLHWWPEMTGRYAGSFHDKGSKHGGNEPENPAYEIIATLKSQFVPGDPSCTAKAMRVDRPETRLKAIALRHTLNRLIRESGHTRFWRKQFPDWCFAFSAFCVQRNAAPLMDRGPVDGPIFRPQLRRISPPRLRYDPRATEQIDWRWVGFEQVVALSKCFEKAKREKGWHQDALKSLEPDTGSMMEDFPKEGQGVKRDDVKLYVCWCPEEQTGKFGPDKGFHGSIRMYAETGKSRKNGPLVLVFGPVPYYGPRNGPIYMSGQETVPDMVHPLAVIPAIENIARELRLESQVMSHAMANYKRIFIDGNPDANSPAKIKSTRHGNAIHLKGWKKENAGEFVIGGIDSETLAAYQFLLERLNKRAGVSDTSRGQAQAGRTATAETYAAAGGEARTDGLRDEWRCHGRDAYRALGELICMDEQFYIPLEPAAVQEMVAAGADPNNIPTYVQGGHEDGESFEDYEIDIDTLSMRHQTQEEREMAAEREMALWTALGPLIPQTPFLGWPSILADIGDAWGKPELAERLNVPMAEQIAGLLLATQLQGGFQDSEPKKQPQMRPRNAQAINITGSAKTAAQPVTPQIGMGAQGKSSGGMAGNKAGAKAGGMAKRKSPQKVGAK